jgi:hypothetical protein
MRYRGLLSILAIFLFQACSDKPDSEYLQKASGKSGDILLIMDSVQWRGELGKELRKVLHAEVTGLPQGEPMFNVLWIHPSKGLTMLTKMRNVLYVFTLDQSTPGSKVLRQQFSDETLNRISTDTSFTISTRSNEYARDQEVMYLFHRTEAGLINYLQDHKQNIIDFFNRTERQRISKELFRTKSTRGVAAFLREEQQVELRVPIGYQLADKSADFVWLRSMTAEIDKDIFVAWKPYESEYQLLPDSLIAWRDRICKEYLYEDPERPETFLMTELENARVTARQVQLNKHFAMELRGLWRTNLYTMGGPFLSYALVDEPRGLLYYIEGFVYAPGKDKREMMRELETILWTFRTSDELAK